jgi:hypothetical protein
MRINTLLLLLPLLLPFFPGCQPHGLPRPGVCHA